MGNHGQEPIPPDEFKDIINSRQSILRVAKKCFGEHYGCPEHSDEGDSQG